MREPLWERVKIWVCARIGHRPYGDVMLNGDRWCRRCGRSVPG